MSRWVAGSTSHHRWCFIAFLSEVELAVGDRPATHQLYALRRYRSRHANPLQEYSFSRTVPVSNDARLTPPGDLSTFESARQVDLLPLLANPDVLKALGILFRTVDHDDFASANTRGLASVFDSAYHVFDVLVEPTAPRANEVMTTIYCNAVEDLRLHSVFRVTG